MADCGADPQVCAGPPGPVVRSGCAWPAWGPATGLPICPTRLIRMHHLGYRFHRRGALHAIHVVMRYGSELAFVDGVDQYAALAQRCADCGGSFSGFGHIENRDVGLNRIAPNARDVAESFSKESGVAVVVEK